MGYLTLVYVCDVSHAVLWSRYRHRFVMAPWLDRLVCYADSRSDTFPYLADWQDGGLQVRPVRITVGGGTWCGHCPETESAGVREAT
jgi:hypothetical protein